MASHSPAPALAPPAGETTDFMTPDTLWKWNVLCQTACLSFAAITFILRTYIRSWIKRVWILEDYLCCFSFIGLVVYSSLLTTIVHKHGGIHEWDITRPEAITILYYNNIIQICYSPAAACTKVTILLLYLRVFSPRRWSRLDIAIRAFIAIVCCFYFASTVVKLCQCLPRGRIWDKSVPGHCLNPAAILDISGLFNLTSDVGILLIPMKALWNLQMSRKRKIGIYAIFTVGTVAPVFSAIGFVVRYERSTDQDQSYSQPLISLWAFVSSALQSLRSIPLIDYRTAELALGVVLVCFPTLPSIMHGRPKKPSMSIILGSGRLHSKKESKHTSTVDREYYELSEGRPHEVHINIPQNDLINKITGGKEDGFILEGLKRDYDTPLVGILKTSEIEHSCVQEDHIVASFIRI